MASLRVPARAGPAVTATAPCPALLVIYPANLDTRRALGADIAFFSPLADAALPSADALWLPGGYPELHASALAGNTAMSAAIRRHVEGGKPALAECGGLLYLLDSLTGLDGQRHAMAGVLRGDATMQPRLAALGLQAVALPEGELRGHCFHDAALATTMLPIAHGRNPDAGSTAEAVYRTQRRTASYIPAYFASNPGAVAALFKPTGHRVAEQGRERLDHLKEARR